MTHHNPPLEAVKSPKPMSTSFLSSKLSIFLIVSLFTVPILFQIQALKNPFPTSVASDPWSVVKGWGEKIFAVHHQLVSNCSLELDTMLSRLRDSVTFLPLKDHRFASTAMDGHTWFMSSLNDTYEDDDGPEHLYFPSDASNGKLLCLMGRDQSDGGKNSYALAWPEGLPRGAVLLRGLTFVSDSYYDYINLWHGSAAMMPFVDWHVRRGCVVPTRWILYYRGELRLETGSWVRNMMEATFGNEMKVEGFESGGSGPTCLEKAVVFRHNLGRMGRERRVEAYDTMRCKARAYCNVSQGADDKGRGIIGMTVLLRSGARSFKNESGVVKIFERECRKVAGCRSTVARSEDLSFCEQVKLMSSTDILASPHGAQMTNLILMDRNSSLMEFFPKGWLELAGAGQYVFHWLASWSGMRHQGAWWDPDGPDCPDPLQHRACWSFYKPGQIGHNGTQLAGWITDVLHKVKNGRLDEAPGNPTQRGGCPCS